MTVGDWTWMRRRDDDEAWAAVWELMGAAAAGVAAETGVPIEKIGQDVRPSAVCELMERPEILRNADPEASLEAFLRGFLRNHARRHKSSRSDRPIGRMAHIEPGTGGRANASRKPANHRSRSEGGLR